MPSRRKPRDFRTGEVLHGRHWVSECERFVFFRQRAEPEAKDPRRRKGGRWAIRQYEGFTSHQTYRWASDLLRRHRLSSLDGTTFRTLGEAVDALEMSLQVDPPGPGPWAELQPWELNAMRAEERERITQLARDSCGGKL